MCDEGDHNLIVR